MICNKLKDGIKKGVIFDVSGGCGIDLSNGKSNCMAKDGLWFKFCPFCGKEIISEYKNKRWNWYENQSSKGDV